jgi:maltose alpha-D-glucosyltransferase / alpha-amylase
MTKRLVSAAEPLWYKDAVIYELHVRAYSADVRMRLNRGIRRRSTPLVDNNRRRIELLNSLLLSFPGTPILHYGDEIGMGDNIYLGARNGVRTAMQWNADRNAGFSTATPARLYSPVIMDPLRGYEAVNVAVQQSDPSSLLNWLRNRIVLRKLFSVFGRGSMKFFDPANRKVLAHVQQYRDQRVLCVANLSRFARPVGLDLSEADGAIPVEMLGYVEFPPIERLPYGSLQFPLARTSAKDPANGGKYGSRRTSAGQRGGRLGRHAERGHRSAARDRRFR